ncbi:MAG: type I restriction endonuclease [Armatimonadota bacterium]
MDLIDRLIELSAKIAREKDQIITEEAAKTAWVMPFLMHLGYDIYNPSEVIPEFTTDVGTKKGEKVDYCIQVDGQPVMLIECKAPNSTLSINHATQLYRYFSVTKVRFAILTNGTSYQFYTDLEEPNKMDDRPFFEFNLLEVKDTVVDELKKFAKVGFDVDRILATASELKYIRELKRIILQQMNNPTDEFVKLIISEVYSSPKTQSVVKQFAEMIKRAYQQLLTERINERLKSALNDEMTELSTTQPVSEPDIAQETNNGVVTTDEEVEAFMMIKVILRGTIDISRVKMRDAVTYCAILLDDNNRLTICRLRFNQKRKKYIGLIGADKLETKYELQSVDDIISYTDELRAVVNRYVTEGTSG